MTTSKIIIFAVLIVAALTIFLLIGNSNSQGAKTVQYIHDYAPNSLAYFNCKADGVKEGNLCSTCEALFAEADKNRTEYNIANDQDLIDFVASKNKECVNQNSGGK